MTEYFSPMFKIDDNTWTFCWIKRDEEEGYWELRTCTPGRFAEIDKTLNVFLECQGNVGLGRLADFMRIVELVEAVSSASTLMHETRKLMGVRALEEEPYRGAGQA